MATDDNHELCYDEVDAPMVRIPVCITDLPNTQRHGCRDDMELGHDDLDCGKQSKNTAWTPLFTKIDLCFAVFSLVTFSFDYITDIKLMIEYYQEDKTEFFLWTLVSIVVPSILSGILSIGWYLMEKKVHLANVSPCKRTLNAIRSTCSFFQLGRIFRQTEYTIKVAYSFRLNHRIKHAETDQERIDHEMVAKELKESAIAEKRDAAILGLIDGFLESALQLILQLFLMFSYNLPLTFVRVSFLCAAWISTALNHTSYYRANRRGQHQRKNASYFSSSFYFLWRLFELGPRYVIISLTLTHFLPWCLVIVPVHIAFVYLLFKFHKPQLDGLCPENEPCSQKCLEQLFLLMMSYLGIFCFSNLFEGRTRRPAIIFYVVFYGENLILTIAIVWYIQAYNLFSPWIYSLIFLPIGLVCHMIFAYLFYRTFHPSKWQTKKFNNMCKCCD